MAHQLDGAFPADACKKALVESLKGGECICRCGRDVMSQGKIPCEFEHAQLMANALVDIDIARNPNLTNSISLLNPLENSQQFWLRVHMMMRVKVTDRDAQGQATVHLRAPLGENTFLNGRCDRDAAQVSPEIPFVVQEW